MATVFDVAVILDAPGTIAVQVGGKQDYSSTSGSNPWNMFIYIDGTFVNSAGGGRAPTDALYMSGVQDSLPAGQHQIRVDWTGASSISLYGLNMIVTVTYV